ncbi:DUF721 domain-containing protein [Pontibacter sp. G13]|uniref:DUF721 domain-containing protein n=1 Tax=Pontibacter sp. G13 TaxID=3074898 RepID=UPI00288A8019|nr:DUF721 domain-containing protein [Pontibacter sp. G13]WNJ16304.1 DUF721 domain-containing protein [Pontibacter sp. G13]
MSNKPYVSLGEAIQSYLDKYNLRNEARIHFIISEWDKLMGAPIAQNTEKIWFKDGVFYVKVSSPVWKQELQMARLKIRDIVNRRLKQNLVQEVRIL